jgi:hypothetical protein
MATNKNIFRHKLLILVVLVAAVLRFWNLFEIPLTHDEISALNRTHFDNFNDLIELGVKADTHPPGVQVFTYFWVKTFGYEQWVVKLPFILMGLGSLLLSYVIFKKWSNETVALLVISFLAVLQFTVMYSQIARPYISGMFLVLCMVYFWDGLVRTPEKGFWKNLLLTGFFGALCGYNHHFSLLAAFIIGATGILVIERTYLLKYLSLGVLITLLYLPNISIFLYQLDRGGVGEWLGAPTPRFILDFFSYSFNHSLPLMFTFGVIIAIGIYQYQKSQSIKWVVIAGSWFFAVWIIGYYYSVYRNPVLQFSMLLFFFPFLLFSLLGWMNDLGKKSQALLVLGILTVGTTSLTFHRKHFEIFYANRYFQMKTDAAKCDAEHTCFVFATYPHFLTLDFPRGIDFPAEHLAWEDKVNSLQEFEEYIIHCNKDQLFLGHVEQFPKELIAVAYQYYPYLKEVNYTSGAASYLFVRNGEHLPFNYSGIYDVVAHPTINFDDDKRIGSSIYIDTSEWSIGAELSIQDQLEHHYDLLMVSAQVELSKNDQDILLVAEFPGAPGEEPYFYAAKSSLEFYRFDDNTVTITIAFSLDNVLNQTEELPMLKTYIWNRSKLPFKVLDYHIELLEGNRMKYCLWEDF